MLDSIKRTVLLLSPDVHTAQVLEKLLQHGGHFVDTVHHELVASLKIESRRYYAVVVDFCDERSVDEALSFCKQVKTLRPDQRFVLRAGHGQYVPETACPDAAVSNDELSSNAIPARSGAAVLYSCMGSLRAGSVTALILTA